jgi:PhnB protein
MKAMKIIPYLSFNSNCEEALKTYQKILGGEVEIRTRYDNPAMKAPEHYKNKVLHARFHFDNESVYASDVFPGSEVNDQNNNIALSLDVTDVDRAKKIFSQLSEGGKIKVPFEKQFWGEWHGNFTDRFGISWMVNCTG